MKFDICRLAKKVHQAYTDHKKSSKPTCIMSVDNLLQQTCYHQAGANDANASCIGLMTAKRQACRRLTVANFQVPRYSLMTHFMAIYLNVFAKKSFLHNVLCIAFRSGIVIVAMLRITISHGPYKLQCVSKKNFTNYLCSNVL